MTAVDRFTHRQHMALHRQQRRAEGYREATIWLPETVHAQLDALIKAGRYKNRSDALAAAAVRFLADQDADQP